MRHFNIEQEFDRVNFLSIIFFSIVVFYGISSLLVITPNYIILENRVMYDRIYDLDDQIDGTFLDLTIFILLFLLLLVLFYKKLKLLVIFLAGYFILVIILPQIFRVSIHDSNMLMTPLFLILWILFDKSSFKVVFFRSLNFFYISIILLGVISILYSISYMYGTTSIQDRVISFPVIFFSIASQLTPYLLVLLFFLSILQIVLRLLKNDSRSKCEFEPKNRISSHDIKKRSPPVVLAVILSASILIAFIPHLPAINPENRFVGYDSGYYITWIKEIDKGGTIGELLTIALQQSSGDRFLSLIVIFGLHSITAIDIENMIEYIPLILTPLLVFVTYFLTYEISRNSRLSLMASFLTPFSIQVSMGIYAGYYSNWIAIIIAYTTIILFIRSCRSKKSFYPILLLIGLTTLCFTHLYTWIFFAICLAISTLLISKYHFPKVGLRRCIMVAMILVSSSIGFVIPWLTSGTLAGFHNFMDLYNNDFDEFNWLFIELFNFVVLISHGGLFSSIMIPLLCIVSLFSIHRRSQNIFIYCIVVLFAIAALTIFFGGLEFKTRILYNLPFQIPTAFGLLILYEKTKNKFLLVACILSITAYSLYSLTNFYLIPPEIMYPQDFSN